MKLTMQPLNSVNLDASTAKRTLQLMDVLEKNNDIQEVYPNFEISNEVVAIAMDEEIAESRG